MKKVLTVGIYDLFHFGHLDLLRRARAAGDYLIVAIQDSNYAARYKPGTVLLYPTEERVAIIKAIRYVDKVVVYTSVDDIIQKVDFDIFCKGTDQCNEGFQNAVQYCKENGKVVLELPRTNGISTTLLKEIIKSLQ